MSNIFARKVSIFCKNGTRLDYTHVTAFNVYTHPDVEAHIWIKAETIDDSMSSITEDMILIKDIEHTFIDWYIPNGSKI